MNLSHLPTLSTRKRVDLARLLASLNHGGRAYHHLDFGNGLVLDGEYDLAPYFRLINLPESLQGLRVLDVGTSTGAIALECALRGASVTAIDLFDHTPLVDFASILELDVNYQQRSVFDLSPSVERYDVVLCGSVLLHISEPFTAVKHLASVCASSLYIWTACPKRWWRNLTNQCYFVGRRSDNGRYYSYWELAGPALRTMLALVDFRIGGKPRYFILKSRGTRPRFATPHVAVQGVRTDSSKPGTGD